MTTKESPVTLITRPPAWLSFHRQSLLRFLMFSSFDDKKYRQRTTDRSGIDILHVLLSVCRRKALVEGGRRGRYIHRAQGRKSRTLDDATEQFVEANSERSLSLEHGHLVTLSRLVRLIYDRNLLTPVAWYRFLVSFTLGLASEPPIIHFDLGEI